MADEQKVFRIEDGLSLEDRRKIKIPTDFTHISLPAGMGIVNATTKEKSTLTQRTVFRVHRRLECKCSRLLPPGVPETEMAAG